MSSTLEAEIHDGRARQQQFETPRETERPYNKPKLLLVGTSNILGINEDKLTTAVETKKVVRYTLEETDIYHIILRYTRYSSITLAYKQP